MIPAHTHIVVDGESAESIAAHVGLPLTSIWDIPQNQALRELRQDPHILYPGDSLAVPAVPPDRLAIPETKPLTFQRATGQEHTLTVHVPMSRLKLQLKKHGKPRANQQCMLVVDGVHIPLFADSDGKIDVPIAARAAKATLTFGVGEHQITYDLVLRGIHPSSERNGCQARLHNLGYPTDVDGDDAPHQAALSLFQENQTPKLPATGQPDDATKAKLKDVYGC